MLCYREQYFINNLDTYVKINENNNQANQKLYKLSIKNIDYAFYTSNRQLYLNMFVIILQLIHPHFSNRPLTDWCLEHIDVQLLAITEITMEIFRTHDEITGTYQYV